MKPWTVADVIAALEPGPVLPRPLPAPNYTPREGPRVACAVESMRSHMTDEGWQIMRALEFAGYSLAGYGITTHTKREHSGSYNRADLTDLKEIVSFTRPSTLLLQDKREWDLSPRDFRDPMAKFTNVDYLRTRDEVFKLTILKDAHQRPGYHMGAAEEMGCHAWVIYYHPDIVRKLAPYVRKEHLVRAYHTLDESIVPAYSECGRRGCLLSGAVSGAYPLRQKLVAAQSYLPDTDYLPHPGYHRSGCATPTFLKILARYRAAVCTSSRFGYALRKIAEATAAGCVVITDLPSDEVMPDIDANLVRVRPDINVREMCEVIRRVCSDYSAERQEHYAALARYRYDYRLEGVRLAERIESLRMRYGK